jgi:hypothetical protein
MNSYLASRAAPIEVNCWVVIEVPSPRPLHWDRHVIGLVHSQVCISPPIRSFDANRATAHCTGHRSLSLLAEPTWTSETRKAWTSWKLLNNVSVERDITVDIYQAMKTLRSEVVP